jgi:ATP-dependent helicase/nuclease subunit A
MTLQDALGLTGDQKAAATAPGSVAVVAGAGTGKTHMIVGRYLFHLIDQGLTPLAIVAVTFTEKAAAELRARIRSEVALRLPDQVDLLAELEAGPISTLHSLAARICREHADAAGVPADFQVMDEQQSTLWLADQLPDVLGLLPDGIMADLPYSLIAAGVRQFLRDPEAADAALRHDSSHWKALIGQHRQQAIADMLADPAVVNAREILLEHYDQVLDRSDKAFQAMEAALAALADVADGDSPLEAFAVFAELTTRAGGQAKNWRDGAVEPVKAANKALRQTLGIKTEKGRLRLGYADGMLELAYGPADDQLAAQLEVMRTAWQLVKDEIAARKAQMRHLDFADLEIHAAKALSDPHVRQYYAERWQAFIVDEFQDTNPIQAQILNALKHASPLTVVGDEQQSIYGFRGADVQVFRQVRAGIAGEANGRDVRLDRSFRTHAALVASTNAIFAPLLGDAFQPLAAQREQAPHDGPHVQTLTVQVPGAAAARQRVEAAWIARTLTDAVQSGLPVWDKKRQTARPLCWGDIAILTATWKPLDSFSEVLTEWRIPHVHAGGDQLLETRPAKDGMAWLQALSDRRNDRALAAVMRGPAFALDDAMLYRFVQETGNAPTWWDRLERTTLPEFDRCRTVLGELRRRARTDEPHRLLQWIDRETGYGAIQASLSSGDRRLADWQGFIDLVRDLGAAHGDLLGVVRHLQRLVAAEVKIKRPSLQAGDAVSLMTIHAAKGLEWPLVVVADLSSQGRSSSERVRFRRDVGVGWKLEAEDDDDEAIEPGIVSLLKALERQSRQAEKLRVDYVALTRARDLLLLTANFRDNAKSTELPRLDPHVAALPAAALAADLHTAAPAALPPQPTDAVVPDIDPSLIAGLTMQVETLAVSALTEYAVCPRRFEYAHVLGHPGTGQGDGQARRIGNLTHHALEHGIDQREALRPVDHLAPDSWLDRALDLARSFRTSPAFAPYRDGIVEREVAFQWAFGGITWEGRVDAVGADFVLDYKTGTATDRDYRYQLWLYARALGKSRAVIADLAKGEVTELTASGLNALDADMTALVGRLTAGGFPPTPSEAACRYCSFNAHAGDGADGDAAGLCDAAVG